MNEILKISTLDIESNMIKSGTPLSSAYVDLEDYNTSLSQRQRIKKLLAQNPEKVLSRKKKPKHVIDLHDSANFIAEDEE